MKPIVPTIDAPPAFDRADVPVFDVCEIFTPFTLEAFFDAVEDEAFMAAEEFDEIER